MISYQFRIEFEQLVEVKHNFGPIPVVLILVLVEPVVGVSVEPDLDELILFSVDVNCRDALFKHLEAVVDVVEGVEKRSVDCSLLEGSRPDLQACQVLVDLP